MIPILYEATETSFTSQGLGRLFDAISCIVKEERNGKYELELTYPVDGRHFKDIQYNRIILAKPNQTSQSQPFRIYKISKPLKKQCKIYAEHVSYQLSFIPVSAFQATSFLDVFTKLPLYVMEYCPFTFWTDKQVVEDYSIVKPTSIRAILGGAENSLVDVYGTCEYEFDRYTVKAWLNRGHNNGVKLLYGKNIIDLQQEENIEKVVTGIAPFWKSGEDETVVTLPEGVIHCANHNLFPFERTVPYDFTESFETQPTEAQLRAKAQQYVDANLTGTPEVNITLTYINLYESEEYQWLTGFDTVSLCDTITVDFELLDVEATAKVVETEYDVLKERYSKIQIGDAQTTLAKQMVNMEQGISEEFDRKTSYLRNYAYEQTQMLSGANGGNVKFKYNVNNQPSGIKFMSGAEESSAQYQLLINYAGLGFSSDYGNTFTNAWTLDGQLSASFITTGQMSANRIYAGVLSDVNGYNTFDLDAGTLSITNGSIHLGTFDTTTHRYPFSVDSNGALVAVSATLVDANLSGTVTTDNGLYKSALSAGQLAMYYDNTLYGQFSGGAWTANQTKRGIGLYLSQNASYMFFGRYSATAQGYQAAYIINFGLDPNTNPAEIGYSEKHIFYDSVRVTGGLYLSSTLTVAGATTFNGTPSSNNGLNINSGNIYVASGNIRLANTSGLTLTDSVGNIRMACYMDMSDAIQIGNANNNMVLNASQLTFGSASTAHRFNGTLAAYNFFQTGSFSTSVSTTERTGSVSFGQSFTSVPLVFLTPIHSADQIVRLYVTNRTVSGFDWKLIGNGASQSITIQWLAVNVVNPSL